MRVTAECGVIQQMLMASSAQLHCAPPRSEEVRVLQVSADQRQDDDLRQGDDVGVIIGRARRAPTLHTNTLAERTVMRMHAPRLY